jgi:hypothetical protein
LIVSPENPITVHKKLVKKLVNEINLTKTENLAGEKPQIFVEIDQKKTI